MLTTERSFKPSKHLSSELESSILDLCEILVSGKIKAWAEALHGLDLLINDRPTSHTLPSALLDKLCISLITLMHRECVSLQTKASRAKAPVSQALQKLSTLARHVRVILEKSIIFQAADSESSQEHRSALLPSIQMLFTHVSDMSVFRYAFYSPLAAESLVLLNQLVSILFEFHSSIARSSRDKLIHACILHLKPANQRLSPHLPTIPSSACLQGDKNIASLMDVEASRLLESLVLLVTLRDTEIIDDLLQFCGCYFSINCSENSCSTHLLGSLISLLTTTLHMDQRPSLITLESIAQSLISMMSTRSAPLKDQIVTLLNFYYRADYQLSARSCSSTVKCYSTRLDALWAKIVDDLRRQNQMSLLTINYMLSTRNEPLKFDSTHEILLTSHRCQVDEGMTRS